MNNENSTLYFNNSQLHGVDINRESNKRDFKNSPTAAGWIYIGTYPYDIALDLAHLYLQIPFEIRKTLGEIEIGEKFHA